MGTETIERLAGNADRFLLGILVLVWLFLAGHLARGQTLTTGQVVGAVTDPSGAAVPGAKVELRDIATGAVHSTTTNDQGQYLFPQIPPGRYSVTVTASGFAQAIVPLVDVEVAKTSTINVGLKLGKATEIVEVHSTPGAELQTLDSTVGNIVSGEEILALPTFERSATSLLLLQPLAMPLQSTSTSQSSRFGGQVAGARSDQNSFLLDGGEITNPISGNSDYLNAFSGRQEGAVPTPVESIQEFKVETNNPSGSVSVSGGAQVVMVTKRGGDQFHGSLYEYYFGSALNANRWDANRIGRARPNIVDNRFGGSMGGHFLPGAWKTFFYANFEERRRSQANFITRLVPTDTLKRGIITIAGVQYNFNPANGPLTTACQVTATNPTGACDPRNRGFNPVIKQLWQFEPTGNDVSQGDGVNTIGFSAFGKFPVHDDLGVLRMDHSFGSRLHATASYRQFVTDAGFLRQVDIGGLLPGDANGVPKVLSSIPRQPRYLVTGLTANVTPLLTNDLHFSWLRDQWEWVSLAPFPQLPGATPAALVPGGDTVNALVPLNIDTQNARTRMWNSHGLGLRDDASWVRGNQLLQFGGSFNHTWVFFRRDDGQQNSQKTLQYFMGNTIGGINFPGSFRPNMPSSQISNWNNLYAQVLGMVDAATILRTRDSQLQLLPQGTDLKNTIRYDQATLYVQDAWHLRPTLTVNFGLAWATSVPPVEDQGKLMMTVFPGTSGGIVDPRNYLQKRQQAALAGQVFNPPVGFTPIQNSGRKYPFDFVRNNFEPRVAAAWSPNFTTGLKGRLFGSGKTVLRGGYWRFYDRLNGVQAAVDTLQAVGFGQSLLCLGPGINSAAARDCRGSTGTDPTTAFRIGIDGNTVTLPPLPATVTPPVIPGNVLVPSANISFVPNSQVQDPAWKPGSHKQWDFTIQRELPAKSRLEIGYVGHTARNIYQGLDLNQVPFFMTAGGQSFAQAFDALAQQIKNPPITPQPFFETLLAGSSFCMGQPSCTAGVAAKFAGDVANQRVRNVFNGIQSAFTLGPATNAATQFTNFFYWSSLAESNYHAAFVSYHVRAYRGLTLDANFTYGHSLDDVTVNQDSDQAFSNSYDPHYDYGTSLFDRKYVLTLLGVWEVPFHSQVPLVKRVVGGWRVSPIVSIASGLPLRVLDGSGQEFGQSSFGFDSEAIRIGSVGTSAGVNRVAPTSGCGSSASGKGSGLNTFANPQTVCNEFRSIQVSTDATSRGGTLRGLSSWNLDLSLAKKIPLPGERTKLTFSAEFFNTFNHVNFLNPAVNLQSPQTFGVITTQANDPRQIQLGLRFDF
ncbi:MAG TPA: carboxypeptidase-like regulatory domain-containing protein [Candidatus Dormibacteraeota bacterium]|nr:carboxypeptidase-like regulatory domain-containing protein [Candidatus Dormibacteraeota bacterium]